MRRVVKEIGGEDYDIVHAENTVGNPLRMRIDARLKRGE